MRFPTRPQKIGNALNERDGSGKEGQQVHVINTNYLCLIP